MVSDPRCPHCDGKVSATATWCMHCGADFETPVEADSGRPVADRQQTDRTGSTEAEFLGEVGVGPAVAAVGLAVLGLVTVPIVAPANVTLAYLAAVVGVAAYAARQSTVGQATRKGLRSLAVVPLVLWLLAAFFVGAPLGSVVGPAVYAALFLFLARRVG